MQEVVPTGLMDHVHPQRPEEFAPAGGAEPRSARPLAEPSGLIYLVIVITLSVALLGGGVGWFVLALYGAEMPEGLAAVMATIAGGLVGVLLPGGPRSGGRAARE